MARKYEHIQGYEKKIKEMLEQRMAHREIGEALGFSKEQVKGFVKRLHAKERRLAAGNPPSKRGRPVKDDRFAGTDKVSELKYELARNDFVNIT